jgi:DNA-binding transcriptional ArsR family regulator
MVAVKQQVASPDVTRRDPVVLSDPRSIRALAHPARLAVIDELYTGNELTATECAEIAGLSPSAMSYHLRSLERAGIVERAESTGDGRERPWRAAGSYLRVKSDSGVAETAAVTSLVMSRLSDQFTDWLARRETDDKVWRDASTISNGQVWLLPEELDELRESFGAHIDRYRSRSAGDRPDGSRRVRFALLAFPNDKRK